MSVARFVDRHGDFAAALLVGALGMAARWHGLSDKPYWLDELLTVRRAGNDLLAVVLDSLRNHHLPTYFLLISTILPIGATEAVVRLPSVLFGAISSSLACAVGTRVAGRGAGLIAGLLMALSPFQVQMGQEARSYAMVTGLIMLGLLGLVILMRHATEGDEHAGGARSGWIAYFCGSAGALLVLPIAIPWLIAANLAVVAVLARRKAWRTRFARRWLAVQIAILAVALPGLVALGLVDQSSFVHAFDWIPPVQGPSIRAAVAATYLMRITDIASLDLMPAAVPGLGLIVVCLAALGAWHLRRRPSLLGVVGLASLALPVALLGVSLIQPVAVPRYFSWGAGPFFVLVGIGIAAMPHRVQVAACAVAFVAGVINLLPYYDAETKPRWDLAAIDLTAQMRSNDIILAADPYVPMMLEAFAARAVTTPNLFVTQSVDEAASGLAAGRRVWAVYGRVGQGNMESFEGFRTRIAALGSATLEYEEGRHIRLLRFDPAVDPHLSDARTSGGASFE